MKGAAYALLGVYMVSIFGNSVMAVWVGRRVKREGEEAAEEHGVPAAAVQLAAER
jgi:hypothetical protein